ncbi:MAG: UDP-N-acetylmuramate dehydrogenase [Christensenellaceae bacterium]|jgi:UDP-N-acetylmuramate dehydrogenase
MYQKLIHALSHANIPYKEQVSLAEYTAFRTGGAAKICIFPRATEEIMHIFSLLRETHVPYYILGGGSNVLVADEGICGAVIVIGKDLAEISVENDLIHVQAGAKLSTLVREAHTAGFTGLEFASGIPGTVGGGIYMNAGAFGGTLSEFITTVTSIDQTGKLHTFTNKEAQFDYRKSVFMENEHVILSGTFSLLRGNIGEAKARMQEISRLRKEKQPLEYPSAGSTFKRPPDQFAGHLIEQSGLKGFCIGNACVSQKHAGFIINKGGASAKDIMMVIAHVEKTVYEKTGIQLEKEVRMINNDALLSLT